jgi:polyisoprenoid-binding protein YceI
MLAVRPRKSAYFSGEGIMASKPSAKAWRFLGTRLLWSGLAVAAFASSAAAQVSAWQIDPNHSAAQFSVRHMMISTVRGAFTKMSGTVQYDPAELSKIVVEVTIDAASVDTRNDGRDKDLRSPNFFDVDKFPNLSFKSTHAEAAGPGKIKLTGDLTIHGVTKQVTFDVDGPSPPIKDPRGSLHMGASATTVINRKDFGLMWNNMVEGVGAIVSDNVTITLDVELVHRAAPAGD